MRGTPFTTPTKGDRWPTSLDTPQKPCGQDWGAGTSCARGRRRAGTGVAGIARGMLLEPLRAHRDVRVGGDFTVLQPGQASHRRSLSSVPPRRGALGIRPQRPRRTRAPDVFRADGQHRRGQPRGILERPGPQIRSSTSAPTVSPKPTCSMMRSRSHPSTEELRAISTKNGPHVVTGPVFVEGAEPGDVVKIEVLEAIPRVPYGVVSTGTARALWRALPTALPQPASRWQR